jgi:hypothetical protein
LEKITNAIAFFQKNARDSMRFVVLFSRKKIIRNTFLIQNQLSFIQKIISFFDKK